MTMVSAASGRMNRPVSRGRAAAFSAVSLLLLSATPSLAASCDQLLKLAIDNTTIATAEARPAGSFAPPTGSAIPDLPAACRVQGVISAVPGSRVGFELWLPDGGWNGKIEMVGNGGYSSVMSYKAMAPLLERGYATVATDTGHTGDDPGFAVDHPEAIVDWGHRAVHVTIAAANP